MGNITQCSTTDADIFLTYLICIGWIKSLHMSILAFDIAQFFPSLNYQLLLKTLDKAGFDLRISCLFSDFLLFNSQTQYMWNYFVSLFFKVNIDVS